VKEEISRILIPALLFILALSFASGQNVFCDSYGDNSECILDQDRTFEEKSYGFNSLLETVSTALFTSTGTANIQVDNATRLSGTWKGSFNISTDEPLVGSGARFRPENGRIIIGSTVPDDVYAPPTSCENVEGDSGYYDIDPQNNGETVEVYCDMNDSDGDGSGWTRIMANDFESSYNSSQWSINSGNTLELRSSPTILGPACSTSYTTTEYIRDLNDLGIDYEEVRYEGRWIALDSWDSEDMALYVNKGGSYQEEVRRTYQHDGTSATEPFPDIHCSEWASDTDNQGPWSGNVSTNDVRDLKFTVGDNQDDDDESLVFDYIRVYVR
jgi:hypothetical protein